MTGEVKASESGGWRGEFVRQSLAPVFGIGRRGRARSYKAFVPERIADLAPRLGSAARADIAGAEAELRALNARTDETSPLRTLGRQLLRTEAIASSAIEGLQLSHARLARASVHPKFDRKAREILNNVRAMEEAIALGRAPGRLTAKHLQEIHALLAGGTHLARYAGQFRDEPGWVDRIPELLDDLLAFVNERTDLSPIEQAAYAHAQFETIHPFPDGNGRVGRCLIHIVLVRGGAATAYVPPVSVALAARRDAYMAGLTCFQRGDLDAWAGFFAQATHAATVEAEGFTERVAALQAGWRARLAEVGARSDSAAWLLLDELPAHPVIDANAAMAIADRTWPAASAALAKLEEAGVLKRRDNRKRGRSWEAPELFDAIRSFEASLGAPADGEDDEDLGDDDAMG
jgi:Fic family protein